MNKEEIDALDETLSDWLDEETLKLAAITKYPSPIATHHSLTREEKIDQIAERFRDIMQILGLDLSDNSLSATPYRVAKMYVDEIFAGLNPSNFPKITLVEDRYSSNNKILVQTSFTSFCEHHFVPMTGTATITYIPNGRLIGLSKISRIVNFFAKRPQLQERLTAQIADSLTYILNTENVAVTLQAQHFCMIARGVEKENSYAITHARRGQFLFEEGPPVPPQTPP